MFAAWIEIHQKFNEIEILQAARLSGARESVAGNESQKWVLENRPEILPRNRYINIQVWSHSRIHLKVPDGDCDFINASPISLSHSKTGSPARYIAAQVHIEPHAVLYLLFGEKCKSALILSTRVQRLTT